MEELDATEEPTTDGVPEKSVECVILAAPEDGAPRADVIFVHGLHGGLGKTWRQGEWRRGHRLYDGYREKRRESLKRGGSRSAVVPKKAVKTGEGGEFVGLEENEEVVDGGEEEERYSDCWPKDWLPLDCPNVRVIALNYTTDVLWRPVWIKKRNR